MVAEAIRTTLGPRGMDKLIVDKNGRSTISNDGATIVSLLDIVHPAARTLVDIAKSQDAEVGKNHLSNGSFLCEISFFNIFENIEISFNLRDCGFESYSTHIFHTIVIWMRKI